MDSHTHVKRVKEILAFFPPGKVIEGLSNGAAAAVRLRATEIVLAELATKLLITRPDLISHIQAEELKMLNDFLENEKGH